MEGNISLLICVVFPFIGALVSYASGRKNKILRDYIADAVTILECILLAGMFFLYVSKGELSFTWGSFGNLGLQLKMDGFRGLYCLIAAFMWIMTTVFSREYLKKYHNRNRYYMFILLTLGATVGVFLSADLLTTFLFFEVMSFTSYVWVAHDETKEALRAAETYLAIAVIGGLVMLMGLFLLYHELGTLRMDELKQAASLCTDVHRLFPAGVCLLFGFGAKAGAFPLHIWLPKAHPVAPAPSSALLSGILTKAGIFGILIVSCQLFYHNAAWGSLILFLGVITMFLGAVLALYSVNIKRVLACSSLSQIGFILVGIGMTDLLGDANVLAVRGTFLHMVNHSLFKLVLFMVAGVIYMNLHELELNDIRGFGRKKPLLNLIFSIGALGIGGIPLFSGYVSKTLLHESIVEYERILLENQEYSFLIGRQGMQFIEWVFLISGGLTIAYMMKLYVCIFMEENSDKEKQKKFDEMKNLYMNRESTFALAGSALVIFILGIIPDITMNTLADFGENFLETIKEIPTVYYFSAENLQGAMISIGIGFIIYFIIVRNYMMKKKEDGLKYYCNRWNEKVDLEDFIYRPLLLKVLPFIGTFISRIGDTLIDSIIVLLRKTIYRDSRIPHELTEGTTFTHELGIFLDHIAYGIAWIRNIHKKEKPEYRNYYEHKLAYQHVLLKENNILIGRSMSFGLLLFCIGFVLTVVYLLIN